MRNPSAAPCHATWQLAFSSQDCSNNSATVLVGDQETPRRYNTDEIQETLLCSPLPAASPVPLFVIMTLKKSTTVLIQKYAVLKEVVSLIKKNTKI